MIVPSHRRRQAVFTAVQPWMGADFSIQPTQPWHRPRLLAPAFALGFPPVQRYA